MLLGYNILSFQIDFGREETAKETIKRAINILRQKEEVKPGDKLIIVSGDNIGVKGATNNIRITAVRDEES
jgi:pyruvate kinase